MEFLESSTIPIVVSCLATISIVVVVYENKIKKLKHKNIESINLISKVAKSWNDLILNQRILVRILEDNFSEEEISYKYLVKKAEIEEELQDNDYF